MSDPIAVMFHHFHGHGHQPSPGSIDAQTFDRLVDRVAAEQNLLGAPEFTEKVISGTLASEDACLTFDDALKCQIDIAVPLLQARGLTAFFFVYSTAFSDGGAELEVFRDFRSQHFNSTESFLEELLVEVSCNNQSIRSDLESRFPPDYLAQYSFYSISDRKLRFLRDQLLTTDQYSGAMKNLMSKRGVEVESSRQRLVMSVDDLRTLTSQGHQIGLHSHTHPTRIDLLEKERVQNEYAENLYFIREVTGVNPTSMSHPCGNYSTDSLSVLRALGIVVGFIDSPTPNVGNDPLCIPRHDHSDLVKRL